MSLLPQAPRWSRTAQNSIFGAVTEHRYPFSVVAADYLRAALGLLCTLGPFLLTEPAPLIAWFLGALALLFTGFGLRTLAHHLTVLELSETGLVDGGPWGRLFGARVAWDGLSKLKLNFYPARRGDSDGWLQLKLTSGRGALAVESGIAGFREIVTRAAREATGRGVDLGPTTVANLESIDAMPRAHPNNET